MGKNVYVVGVREKSAAGRAGVKVADQLIKVNGTAVTGLTNDQVHDVIRRCPPYGIKFTLRSRYVIITCMFIVTLSGQQTIYSMLNKNEVIQGKHCRHLTKDGILVYDNPHPNCHQFLSFCVIATPMINFYFNTKFLPIHATLTFKIHNKLKFTSQFTDKIIIRLDKMF